MFPNETTVSMTSNENAGAIRKYFFKIIGGTAVPPLEASTRYSKAKPTAKIVPPTKTANVRSVNTWPLGVIFNSIGNTKLPKAMRAVVPRSKKTAAKIIIKTFTTKTTIARSKPNN